MGFLSDTLPLVSAASSAGADHFLDIASVPRCSKRTSVHGVTASAVKATPAKSQTLSARAAATASLPTLSESENYENMEPERISSASNISSRESEGTAKTSLTQIRERPLSTDSHTVVRVPLA
jgi:hypothetical protein